MAAMATQAVQSATLQAANPSSIPAKLMSFFVRYPPHKFSAYATGQKIPTLKQRVVMDSKPLSATTLPTIIPGEEATESLSSSSTTTTTTSDTPPSPPASTRSFQAVANPFLPFKNPTTGRWRGAAYGLRRQADLFKIAREHGIEELLPPSIKSSEFRQRRALEKGLAVKGTGEGQKVKGHKWERQMRTNMEKRRKAMEEMPELIRLWEQRGHGRGWKKYPK